MNGKPEISRQMAELEWIWVLSAPLSMSRDAIFTFDMDEREDGQRRRVVPIFENRETAASIKYRLCGDPGPKYGEQAMRLSDLGTFAAQNELEIMMLDGSGAILAHMEARLERALLH